MFPIRFVKEKTEIPFLKYRLMGFMVSAIVITGSLFLLFTKGLNLGIDFTGGIMIEARSEKLSDLAPLRSNLSKQDFGEISLQHFGSDQDVLIRIQASGQNQAAVVEQAKQVIKALADDVAFRRVEYVGPTVGKELMRGGILALSLAMLAMMLYLWFRFEWQYGVGGIIALIHDAIAVLGFYALFGLEFLFQFFIYHDLFQFGVLRKAIFVGWVFFALDQWRQVFSAFIGDMHAIF